MNVKAVEEVTFDPSAREEYLTGFHKRKLERAKHAREVAEKKARAEKIDERRRVSHIHITFAFLNALCLLFNQLREERKADIQRHVQEVNTLLKAQENRPSGFVSESDDEDEEVWGGSEEPPPVDHEAEYIDEDRYTTVMVEEMDISKEGIQKAEEAQEKAKEQGEDITREQSSVPAEPKSNKRTWTKSKPKNGIDRPKVKKKKFRYESKAERSMTRRKEKLKNSKQAKARRET